MSDADLTIQNLLESNALREPVLRAAVQALHLPAGSQGLDAGCGVGLQALILAKAVGPAGHVTGLDISPELLRHAEGIVESAGLMERISFREGDVNRLPFESRSFDWVWSADCVGYPAGDLLPVLKELMRVTRPGGSIAILAWSSQQLLPGYPMLEARLNATCSAYAPYFKGVPPQAHFLRALGGFHQAGLEDVTAQTFVGQVQAPLSSSVRQALLSLFQMMWGEPQPGVLPEDWAEFRRLCLSESDECILNLPDYCAFFTYTMFQGSLPG